MITARPSTMMADGLIASDRLDLQVMRRTLAATQQTWDLNQTWGWDFPMLAMRAAGCSRNMAAGWDGTAGTAPGFPREGWKLQVEGIDPLP